MKKKLLICLVVLGLTSGCGKVTTLPNKDEALVSFTNENLGISAGDLYSKIKNIVKQNSWPLLWLLAILRM